MFVNYVHTPKIRVIIIAPQEIMGRLKTLFKNNNGVRNIGGLMSLAVETIRRGAIDSWLFYFYSHLESAKLFYYSSLDHFIISSYSFHNLYETLVLEP